MYCTAVLNFTVLQHQASYLPWQTLVAVWATVRYNRQCFGHGLAGLCAYFREGDNTETKVVEYKPFCSASNLAQL